jgi:hypothetical protein
MANIAANMVFRRVVNSNPDWFVRVAQYKWPANTVKKDVQTVTGEALDPYRIVQVEDLPNGAALSNSNLPRRLLPMYLLDRAKYLRDSGNDGYHYAFQNGDIYLAPIPAQDINLLVYYVSNPDPMTGDADDVFGGEGEAFHEHVAYCLAYLLDAKQGGANPLAQQQWKEKQAELDAMAVRRTSEPTFIQYDEPRAAGSRGRGR